MAGVEAFHGIPHDVVDRLTIENARNLFREREKGGWVCSQYHPVEFSVGEAAIKLSRNSSHPLQGNCGRSQSGAVRVARAIGQHQHEGPGLLEPMVHAQFVTRMGNHQGGSGRFPGRRGSFQIDVDWSLTSH